MPAGKGPFGEPISQAPLTDPLKGKGEQTPLPDPLKAKPEPMIPSLAPGDPITLPVPLYPQDYALDCETATLEMALTAYGHYYTQAYLFSLENPDTRAPIMGPNKGARAPFIVRL